MNITDFPLIPTIGLLSILVPEELAVQLSMALRRFLILAFIYKSPGESLPDTFSIYEWMEQISDDRKNLSTSDLLQELGLESVDLWIEDLLEKSDLMKNTIESALIDKLFSRGRKTFDKDFKFLSLTSTESKSPVMWLKDSGQDPKGKNLYSRLANLPDWQSQSDKTDRSLNPLLSDEKELILEVLQAVAPMVPRLDPILEKIYPDLILDSDRRLILDIDYVVPDNNSDVGDIQEKIRQLWKQAVIPPVTFTYRSSSYAKDDGKEYENIDCTVYPVCTRFYMRSQYLYAWGYNPRSEERVNKKYDWYAYRLDHIKNKSFKQLSWEDSITIPLQLGKIYTPKHVMNLCNEAWGLDIEQPTQLLILRFNLNYYNRYINKTNRGPSAKKIGGYQEAIDILRDKENKLDRQTLDLLIPRIKAHQNDVYYQAHFRKGDNYTTMRLRSWGDKVEVLAPIDLRNKMIDDANLSICNYGYPSANTTF